ncbi:hypothetical protein EKI60_03645 [Candidatus Saccharibacteria bacterium]|nr:MAG: hypothetical protein EKI60_03645 [Candidatus Saccharibacteria bacterium]
MGQITAKIKPAAGFSHVIHIMLVCLLPALLFVLVRLRFFQLQIGISLILLSKWRMFAVKPRHWPASIRANAVDVIFGLSMLVFMIHSDTQLFQLLWAVLYGVWLVVLKPQASQFGIALQALVAQSVGLVAILIAWGSSPLFVLVAGAWVIAYMSARHFFASFEEAMTRFLALVWSYFAAAMMWILGHWLLFYGSVAQPALLLSVISFGLGGIYYLEKSDRMSLLLRRQLVFVVFAVVLIVLTLSDWGDKTI